MATTCTQCGTVAVPGATFCATCGAALAPKPAAAPARKTSTAPPSRTRPYVLAGSAVVVVMILAAVAYRWSGTGAPASPPATVASPAETESLVQLAEQAESLSREQENLTRQLQDAVAQYQTKSGGALPGGIGAELTAEQRTLLTERLKTEKMGTASLLQDLLTRDEQLRELKARIAELNGRLPESVIATEGQRHERIAMDFLARQGLDTEAAYRLVSQASLTEPLLAGFRVFVLYQNGQFGTWVTQGTAGTSPQALRTQLAALAAKERDAALSDLETTRADRDDLRNLANLAGKSLEDTQAELKSMAEVAERQQAIAGALRYVIGSKSELVRSKVIDNSYRLLPLKVSGTEWSGAAALPAIDPSAYGLRRVNRVTVVPGLVAEGEDYQVNVIDGFLSLSILRPDRFAHYAKYFVVVLE